MSLEKPFKPTAEPWKIAHSSYANAPFVIYVGEIDPKWDRRYPLTGVDWIAEVKHDESEQHQEQISNARLILSAPKALRLLKALYNANTAGNDSIPQPDADLFYEIERFFAELEGAPSL